MQPDNVLQELQTQLEKPPQQMPEDANTPKEPGSASPSGRKEIERLEEEGATSLLGSEQGATQVPVDRINSLSVERPVQKDADSTSEDIRLSPQDTHGPAHEGALSHGRAGDDAEAQRWARGRLMGGSRLKAAKESTNSIATVLQPDGLNGLVNYANDKATAQENSGRKHDQKKTACEQQPCGEGQLTCKGPIRGHFLCTCKAGYTLQRLEVLQPFCIKSFLSRSGSQDGSNSVQSGAFSNGHKWIIGWCLVGVCVGIVLLAALIWGAVSIYKARRSTAPKSVKEEFSSLLDDDKSSVQSVSSRKGNRRSKGARDAFVEGVDDEFEAQQHGRV